MTGGTSTPPATRQVRPHAAGHVAEGEDGACGGRRGAPGRERGVVETGLEVCPGHGQDRIGQETQPGPGQGHLQPRRRLRVADQEVAHAQGVGVERAGLGDAVALVAVSAKVLDRGENAAVQDFEDVHGHSTGCAVAWNVPAWTCSSIRRASSGEMGTNRTYSPGSTSTGGSPMWVEEGGRGCGR